MTVLLVQGLLVIFSIHRGYDSHALGGPLDPRGTVNTSSQVTNDVENVHAMRSTRAEVTAIEAVRMKENLRLAIRARVVAWSHASSEISERGT